MVIIVLHSHFIVISYSWCKKWKKEYVFKEFRL